MQADTPSIDISTPLRQLSTLDDGAGASGRREFQRSFKACDGCRLKKVKCDLGSLDAPSEPPCSRCKREMRKCLFTMSTRGRGSKTRSIRSQAFGAHHLAKASTNQSMLDGHDLDRSTAAIDALAGAALASLPDANPRLHSTRHDISVRELDPTDALSIGMIYGIQGVKRSNSARSAAQNTQSRKRARHSLQPGPPPLRFSSAAYLSKSDSDESTDSHSHTADGGIARHVSDADPDPIPTTGDEPRSREPDTLQQYASVGLQHSRDALRVLAGVVVETRDSTVSRSASIGDVIDPSAAAAAERDGVATASPDKDVASPRHAQPSPSPAASASSRHASACRTARDNGGSHLARPSTPPPLKHQYGWSRFEPVRLKLIKRSEAKHFLNFFLRRMHSFAPHCSPHLLDKSSDALSELVSREPILLGAMLSVASRYDVANHDAHLIHPDTFHRKISKWTQEKISRSFFLPGSHTIGTIEALLILSEWATLDLHDRRASNDTSSDSEDEEQEDDDDGEGFRDLQTVAGHDVSIAATATAGAGAGSPSGPSAAAIEARPKSSGTMPRRLSARSLQRPARLDLRESEKFDDTAWMLTGTALRLAERLHLQNVASYGGISSADSSSRLNAERRMRVWMSSVHADCHLSVRLGWRISSPGLMAPFMNLVRDRTHPFLIRSDASSSVGLSDTSLATGTPRAWIAFRAHAELLQIVFRTCENLYRSRAVTERLLEDEDFVPALKSIRDDLDEWANWTQPRIEPIRDMTSLRLRVEYHYARLYANGVSLDSLKRGLGTFRPHSRVQYHSGGHRPPRDGHGGGGVGRVGGGSPSGSGSGSGSMEIGLSTHPAHPFVREALAAAQSLIRILTVELDSMMCAPARWFLLLVMAAVFCVKTTAVSDTILPLNRCAQSLQQVITALTKAAPDGVHLANRYSMYLRRLAKQLILTDAKARRKADNAARPPRQGEQLPVKGARIEFVLDDGEIENYKTFDGKTWYHKHRSERRDGGHPCCPGATCEWDGVHREIVQQHQPTSAPSVSPQPSRPRPAASGSHYASSTPGTTTAVPQVPFSGRGFGDPNGTTDPAAANAGPPLPSKQQNSGGGGTWWSTGDVLGGEMDPDSFLKWLDEQTMAANTTAAGMSGQGPAVWPGPGSGTGSTSAVGRSGDVQHQAGLALPSATSPFNHQHEPYGSYSMMAPSASATGNTFSQLGQTPDSRSGASVFRARSGGRDGRTPASSQTAIDPVAASTPGIEQDDLLTRMWLDDALTDLASSGLDMPFL